MADRVREPASVVVAGLQEVDPIVLHEVDDAMFLGQAARPGAGVEILQRLRLADAGEGIAENGLDQIRMLAGRSYDRSSPR